MANNSNIGSDAMFDIDEFDDFGPSDGPPADWPLGFLPNRFAPNFESELTDIERMVAGGDLPGADVHEEVDANESDDRSGGPPPGWPFNLPTREALDKLEKALKPEKPEPRKNAPTFEGYSTIEVNDKDEEVWAWGHNTIQEAVRINQGAAPAMRPRFVTIKRPDAEKGGDGDEGGDGGDMIGLLYRAGDDAQEPLHVRVPEQARQQLADTGKIWAAHVGLTRETKPSKAKRSALGPPQPGHSAVLWTRAPQEMLFRVIPDGPTVNPKDLILNPPLALPSPQDDGTELFKRVDHASPDIQAPRARSRSRDFVSPPRLNRNKTKAPRVRFEPSSEPAPRPKKKAATKKTIQSRPTHTKLLKDLGKDEDIENKAAAEKKAAEEDAKAAAARQKADEKRQIARLRSAAKRAAESARKEARRVADRRRAAVKRATRLAEREAAAQHNAARRIVKLKSRAACEKWAELTTKGGE